MKYTLALLALAASALANPMPQAVTADITPSASAPAGCMPTFAGNFEIQIVNVTTSSKKRDVPLEKRVVACGGSGTLVLTLAGGQLHDSIGRTGYIASNYQFQFDAPPQAGAIYTGGWSICGNGSLALGGSTVFYSCLSGTFSNLYDESTGAQCYPVNIDTVGCVSSSGTTSVVSGTTVASGATGVAASTPSSSSISYLAAPPVTSAASYANATVTTAATAVVGQSSEGQIHATTTASSTPAAYTGAGSLLAVGKELVALAAGVAAWVAI
ncbi:hypothetical protein MMC08_001975 [Hypocenomyce scalaris]|nr:hypothetical protein [Hypocenomyce scalaris]